MTSAGMPSSIFRISTGEKPPSRSFCAMVAWAGVRCSFSTKAMVSKRSFIMARMARSSPSMDALAACAAARASRAAWSTCVGWALVGMGVRATMAFMVSSAGSVQGWRWAAAWAGADMGAAA
jgi:hypothetical protein